jgi:primosomal protein N' (replication factor Y)
MFVNELKCHYCGHRERMPYACGSCGGNHLKTVGSGTEKLEEALKSFFPEARIQRMDLDTTRSKYSYETIISDFENHHIDILVGTQMVTKGLDFDKVSLVGVLDIDRMLHFPDFRAFERCYQLIVQVSGRAGRKDIPGKVLIQTSNPQHPVLKIIINGNFPKLYEMELFERRKFGYPPFVRLSRLTLKHTEKNLVDEAAKWLAADLKTKLGPKRTLGPEAPVIDKIRGEYLMDIYVKVERNSPHLKAVKQFMQERIDALARDKRLGDVRVYVDVDCL